MGQGTNKLFTYMTILELVPHTSLSHRVMDVPDIPFAYKSLCHTQEELENYESHIVAVPAAHLLHGEGERP